MAVENNWDVNDYTNARDLFLAKASYVHKRIFFRKFKSYELRNPGAPTIEQFRVPVYDTRVEHVWLSQVRVFDTVKGGYFTTGDLDVNSSFQMTGYTPAYILPNGVKIEENAGDQIVWNGKLWQIADQIEPVQFGRNTRAAYYRTILRRVDRTGQGTSPGVT